MSDAPPLGLMPGVWAGRIQPTGWEPPDGDWVVCLGFDEPGHAYELNVGDEIRLYQTADVSGLRCVTFQARLRPPPSVPAGARWAFVWGVGATEHGRRVLAPGRTRDMVAGAIDVSQLTGDQELRFTLKVEAA